MRTLTKIILPEVEVGDLKIRAKNDNRCESANSAFANFDATDENDQGFSWHVASPEHSDCFEHYSKAV